MTDHRIPIKQPLMYRYLFIFLSLYFLSFQTLGQTKYWIFFTQKDTLAFDPTEHLSQETLRQRQAQGLPLWQASDIPVSPDFLTRIQQEAAVKPIVCSRWLNACSAFLTLEQKKQLETMSFVEGLEPLVLQSFLTKLDSVKEQKYEEVLEQLRADLFTKAKLDGTGIKVGVIDAGFYGAHRSAFLTHLFEEKRIMEIRDFVTPEREEHFANKETGMDNHGTTVLSYITGNNQKRNLQRGLATGATFYLARTDHGSKEFRGEEDYWVAALEWMDSLGVRLVNTSLGYSFGFDNPSENYKPAQMDGKTAATTRAAQIATKEKGMILICSAGNEGSTAHWRVVSAPADAQGVLAVGATNRTGLRANYSSLGPEYLSYLKPDVACYSIFGTSFAAPVITGLAACMLQKHPNYSSKELFDALRKSGNLYPYGNNYIGYGIPDSERLLNLLEGKKAKSQIREVQSKSSFYTAKFKKVKEKETALVFHKQDERNVIKQETVEVKNGSVRIKRHRHAEFTTVVFRDGKGGVEIQWK